MGNSRSPSTLILLLLLLRQSELSSHLRSLRIKHRRLLSLFLVRELDDVVPVPRDLANVRMTWTIDSPRDRIVASRDPSLISTFTPYGLHGNERCSLNITYLCPEFNITGIVGLVIPDSGDIPQLQNHLPEQDTPSVGVWHLRSVRHYAYCYTST